MSAIESSGRPLGELVVALERVDETADVARALALSAERLVITGFSSSTAPSGVRWAALKRPRPGGGPLVRRGDLRVEASTPVIASDGFTMSAPYPKSVHQSGYAPRNLPARPFYPDAARLPSVWETVMGWAAEDALAKRLPP